MLCSGTGFDRPLPVFIPPRLQLKTLQHFACADVFVFSVDNEAEGAVKTACAEKLTNVYFLPLDEFWVTPPEAGPEKGWEGHPGLGVGDSYRY